MVVIVTVQKSCGDCQCCWGCCPKVGFTCGLCWLSLLVVVVVLVQGVDGDCRPNIVCVKVRSNTNFMLTYLNGIIFNFLIGFSILIL